MSFNAACDFEKPAEFVYPTFTNFLDSTSGEIGNFFDPLADFNSLNTLIMDPITDMTTNSAATITANTNTTTTTTPNISEFSSPISSANEADFLSPLFTDNVIEMVPPQYHTPHEVYSKVTAAFSYTDGHHGLLNYLRKRFANNNNLISVAKLIAETRPSFIASCNLLDQEDLVFMEKCFQRTLLEYNKILATSGTPTVIWRRTGQIVASNREFCILTGWSHKQLLRPNDSNDKYIVELMDDNSVMTYFDLFSKLSFGDSQSFLTTQLDLVGPFGDKIETICTLTVRRDVFDIPMMIVGNFLPILDYNRQM